jgi:acetyl-CoA carboxylase biotin carboxyl carrier protein
VPIDFNQLKEFIEAIAKTEISELTIKEGNFELTVQKKQETTIISTPSPVVTTVPSAQIGETTIDNTPSPQPLPDTTKPPTTEITTPSFNAKADNWREITSPMVGTFYRAPAPEESSFVEIGDKISVGQVVCIIEAMKLMNEIEAEVAGKVVEIAVENGEPVEYGQTLLWIAPN